MMFEHPLDWIGAVTVAPFIGSFLSVLVVRLPRNEDVVLTASHCRACDHALAPRDLVPLASFALSGGACRFCGVRLPTLYPALEVMSVVIAVWAVSVVSGGLLWLTCGLGWTLLALAAMDARELILSDLLTLPLILVGLGASLVIDPGAAPDHLIGAAAGFALIAVPAFVYKHVRGLDGLGLGDAKLMAAAGAWLSWQALGGVLLIAAVSTLATAFIWWRGTQAIDRMAVVPFGPGLTLGFWLSWLYGPLVFA